MAFKITKEIVTSKGVTSEAYVRISKYEIDKVGKAIFKIDSFLNKQSVLDAFETPYNPERAIIHELGEHLHIWLQKDLDVITKEMETETVTIKAVLDEDGLIITPEKKEYIQKEVERIVTKKVPDLSSLENGTIFQHGYDHLKQKLVSLYGEENIIIC
jgi:hypothetical protein